MTWDNEKRWMEIQYYGLEHDGELATEDAHLLGWYFLAWKLGFRKILPVCWG